jgi:hypothetical protein
VRPFDTFCVFSRPLEHFYAKSISGESVREAINVLIDSPQRVHKTAVAR